MEKFQNVRDFRIGGGLLWLVSIFLVVSTTTGLPLPAPGIPDNCNSEERCCMPRPYLGNPVRQFEFDPALPMRIRRPAHLIDEEYIAKLERGFQLWKALPDTDPRSFYNQANLHCLYCDNGIYYPNMSWPLEIHGGWNFMPWHRMFVYFNERTVAKLLGDDTFAFPYWNWDNQTPEEPHANILPYFYARNQTSSLWNKHRNNCSEPPMVINLNSAGGCTDKPPSLLRLENNRITYTQVVTGAPTSTLFFGMPYRYGDAAGTGSGTFEDNPHGTVHLWLGDPDAPTGAYNDMGNFATSARDPVFYAHHANVDRFWTLWKTLPGERKEPVDPDFLDSRYTFYDENGDLIIVNVSQTLNHTLLRYEYEDAPITWLTNGELAGQENNITKCYPMTATQTNAVIGATSFFSPTDVLFHDPLTFRVRRPENRSANGTEVLEIQGIGLDPTIQAHWEAFLFHPEALANTSVGCPEFFGTFNYVPHVGMALFDRNRVWRVALGPKLLALEKENFTDIVVTLAQFGPTINPIKFSNVHILYDMS